MGPCCRKSREINIAMCLRSVRLYFETQQHRSISCHRLHYSLVRLTSCHSRLLIRSSGRHASFAFYPPETYMFLASFLEAAGHREMPLGKRCPNVSAFRVAALLFPYSLLLGRKSARTARTNYAQLQCIHEATALN